MTTINVAREHIARGKREDCDRCPIALAIRAVFPDLAAVAVGPTEISIQRSETDCWIDIPPPREVLEFVWNFDDGGNEAVDPFSFDLDYPEEVAA